jgi:hypothetical protein
MNCSDIKKRLSEYVDDLGDEKTRSAMAAHFAECPDCRRELDGMTAMVADLKNELPVAAPDDFVFKLHKKMKGQSGFRKFLNAVFIPFRIKIPFGFATATAVTVAVIFIFQMKQPDNSPLYDNKPETQSIRRIDRTAPPEKSPVVLPTTPDKAESSVAEADPVFRSESPQKPQPSIPVKKKMAIGKESKELGMAAAPEAIKSQAVETLRWHLAVNSTFAGGKDAPPPQLSKGVKPERLASAHPPNLAMETEKTADMVEKEGRVNDEDNKLQYLPLDDVISHVAVLAKRLGGEIISVKQTRHTNPKYFLTISIPGPKINEFYTELDRIGRFEIQPEEPVQPRTDTVTIHLTLTAG